MSELDWALVAEIFADALDEPPDRRGAFVIARCSGQPEVQAAVQRLLQSEAAADPAFLERLSSATFASTSELTVEHERLGPYRLVMEIGRGGMGQVFLAKRADGQFEQSVAVKLLKRGMDSDAILARFLRERQILASLNHPNIARLLDGGIADDGRPYLVMEHIEGLPITRYCDKHRLSIDERLHRFRAVCRAVEYAHRNLVVHRDLKPSNILVAADGQPKLLDFGIAKLLSAEGDAEATTLTQVGARMLTPEYAAPEQFTGSAVTTSTDVYALGAVLYELLAGGPAFPSRGEGPRSDEPPRLSAAPSHLRDADRAASDLATIAAARSTDAARLRRRLAGDLETIVVTALRTEPDRRYASVAALREDIERHQDRLPVLSRPDTAAYRLSRFVARHRIGVLATAAIALLVLLFGATASWQAVRIRRQAEDLEVERDRARREAAAAEEASRFLVGVFEVSDPLLEGQGDSIRARDLLDRGAERIETELSGQPELQAHMLAVIGRAYDNLRLSEQAEPLVTRALELQQSIHGSEGGPVVVALQQLAGVQKRRGNFLDAEVNLRQAIDIQKRIGGDAMTAWSLFVDLVDALHGRGDVEGARAALDEAWSLFAGLADADFTSSRDALRRWARLMSYRPNAEDVDRVYVRLIELEGAASGPRSAAVATAYFGWAAAREWRREFQAADSMLRLALSIERERDSTSASAALVLLKMAEVWLGAGEHERADSLYRATIPLLRERLGGDSRWVAAARIGLAQTLGKRARAREAIPLYELAIAGLRRAGGSDAAVQVPVTEWKLAVALREAGRSAESVPVFRSAIRGLEDRFPVDYLVTANVRRDFGSTLVDLGRAAEAETVLRASIEVLSGRWGEDDAGVNEARLMLVQALMLLQRHDEAKQLLADARSRLEPSRGTEDPAMRRALSALDALDRVGPRR